MASGAMYSHFSLGNLLTEQFPPSNFDSPLSTPSPGPLTLGRRGRSKTPSPLAPRERPQPVTLFTHNNELFEDCNDLDARQSDQQQALTASRTHAAQQAAGKEACTPGKGAILRCSLQLLACKIVQGTATESFLCLACRCGRSYSGCDRTTAGACAVSCLHAPR